MSLIDRRPLRTEIRRRLVERLLTGKLEPDTIINEPELTEELGVSRTPLREALLQLAGEGLLDPVPGRGFKVRSLTRKEADDLFTLGVHLEMLALRLAGGATDEQIRDLRELNRTRAELLESDRDRDRLVDVDDQWHRRLVTGCDNDQLQQMLRQVRRRLYRYTYVFEGHRREVEKAIDDHEKIQAALADENLEAAVAFLHSHWEAGRRKILALME